MIFWQTFLDSIKLPNKRALFRLNRIGMDIVVIYLAILLFFVSIPSLIEQVSNPSGLGANMSLFFLMIYFFIFYYLPLLVIVFSFLSLIAYLGTGLTKLMKRKLRFAILWKMSAFATTVPFAIYTLFALFFPINDLYLWVSLLYTVILLIKMISIYPKRRTRPKQ
ncbi:MAG TPA: hypothetical protein VK044_06965 [Virgibacillus sp.]|nr:hypothetical protein [Virgibacillus sp.]